ncbi:MAG TPA: endonuclease/exonuclease/phosphatase family protein, partial [Povalibacter sp.]
MALKLLTLNMEKDRHLDRVRSTIATRLPDIVCLQEVREADCAELADAGGYQVKYAVMTRMQAGTRVKPVQGLTWGAAMLTRVPVLNQSTVYYSDDPTIRVFQQPNDPRRVLVATELELDGRCHRIITTHFTWSPDGQF